MNPFLVLGLPVTATDDQIRSRYLQLLRENTAEAPGSRYADILAAYAKIKTAETRHEWILMNTEAPSLNITECLDQWIRHAPVPALPSLSQFQEIIKLALKAP